MKIEDREIHELEAKVIAEVDEDKKQIVRLKEKLTKNSRLLEAINSRLEVETGNVEGWSI